MKSKLCPHTVGPVAHEVRGIIVPRQSKPLYARYLCSRAHSVKRAQDDRVSYIQSKHILNIIFAYQLNIYLTIHYVLK